ncbi:UNKNOWN [Stylonychia lemnae]|uniref:Uncharacterized protein n=1 Tax=Stylonychia lemnae TaxID=5949 RepID=A0A078AIU1_STYLE|nr:UNKNOWN [Stylonychia lemnae]|eukprot:CDW82215.1 UNKNOWN [Stylonychia lemnae]
MNSTQQIVSNSMAQNIQNQVASERNPLLSFTEEIDQLQQSIAPLVHECITERKLKECIQFKFDQLYQEYNEITKRLLDNLIAKDTLIQSQSLRIDNQDFQILKLQDQVQVKESLIENLRTQLNTTEETLRQAEETIEQYKVKYYDIDISILQEHNEKNKELQQYYFTLLQDEKQKSSTLQQQILEIFEFLKEYETSLEVIVAFKEQQVKENRQVSMQDVVDRRRVQMIEWAMGLNQPNQFGIQDGIKDDTGDEEEGSNSESDEDDLTYEEKIGRRRDYERKIRKLNQKTKLDQLSRKF